MSSLTPEANAVIEGRHSAPSAISARTSKMAHPWSASSFHAEGVAVVDEHGHESDLQRIHMPACSRVGWATGRDTTACARATANAKSRSRIPLAGLRLRRLLARFGRLRIDPPGGGLLCDLRRLLGRLVGHCVHPQMPRYATVRRRQRAGNADIHCRADGGRRPLRHLIHQNIANECDGPVAHLQNQRPNHVTISTMTPTITDRTAAHNVHQT
jgi:hypothetical protein